MLGVSRISPPCQKLLYNTAGCCLRLGRATPAAAVSCGDYISGSNAAHNDIYSAAIGHPKAVFNMVANTGATASTMSEPDTTNSIASMFAGERKSPT